nr:immunoglobulin light chain junction region [Macaca mulatta]MPO01480.1 immunoglobulin light chain junction region [Macaca mulatta]
CQQHSKWPRLTF